MVDTSGAGTDYHFVSPAVFHSFYCHQCCPISSFLCSVLLINVCLFVRFLLVIVLSDYLFGIFKHCRLLRCLFFFDLRVLITPLVSSSSSCRPIVIYYIVVCHCVHFWDRNNLGHTSDIFTINNKYMLDKKYVNLINVKLTKSEL
jgi:hypothetical protein